MILLLKLFYRTRKWAAPRQASFAGLGFCWVFFVIWLGGSDTFLHKVKVKVRYGFKLGEGRERKPPSYMITRTTEIYLVVIADELSMHLLE